MALFPDACSALKLGQHRRPQAQLRDLARAKQEIRPLDRDGGALNCPLSPWVRLQNLLKTVTLPTARPAPAGPPHLHVHLFPVPKAPPAQTSIFASALSFCLLTSLPPSPPLPHTILASGFQPGPVFSGQQQGYRDPPQALFLGG